MRRERQFCDQKLGFWPKLAYATGVRLQIWWQKSQFLNENFGSKFGQNPRALYSPAKNWSFWVTKSPILTIFATQNFADPSFICQFLSRHLARDSIFTTVSHIFPPPPITPPHFLPHPPFPPQFLYIIYNIYWFWAATDQTKLVSLQPKTNIYYIIYNKNWGGKGGGEGNGGKLGRERGWWVGRKLG